MLTAVRLQRATAPLQARQYSSRIRFAPRPTSPVWASRSPFHASAASLGKKRKDFFSSNAMLRAPAADERKSEPTAQGKRRSTRPSAAPHSLRRVAVEAQRSRDGKAMKKVSQSGQEGSKVLSAICAAQEYDISRIKKILEDFGHKVDPYGTGLYPQVVHVALPYHENLPYQDNTSSSIGDLFVFPSGTVVGWDIPDSLLSSLVTKAFQPAARSSLRKMEEEDLEYVEDSTRDTSNVRGDRIVLGTKQSPAKGQEELQEDANDSTANHQLDQVLAKIAFSSGLARSTKLAVLESLLSDYFESTKSIPEVLSRGGRMPFTRSFISQKTGQLLSIRAQLNLYSELTDSLPDLFWDSRHELGLEGYYDQVGKALDTNIRIKVLNEKMDYAQEIASVLRQQLSEKHSIRLEWIIILLIAVEVLFAIDKEVKEYRERSAAATAAALETGEIDE